ncbi:hypothetical protein CYMTET_6807 [Cymbomonas tetramitiformis]|uniref:Uncharacterized protein n=1 Tax=Cymbomonas tetramitiformis TaxID=36881 RepID=A0AAE0GWQ0_9CHLO|nr:hypothetical protein CYMTET_6807 [Cymbomonas tetramitiformis]
MFTWYQDEAAVGAVVAPNEHELQEGLNPSGGSNSGEVRGLPTAAAVQDLQEQLKAMEELTKIAQNLKQQHIRELIEENRLGAEKIAEIKREASDLASMTEVSKESLANLEDQNELLRRNLASTQDQIDATTKRLDASGVHLDAAWLEARAAVLVRTKDELLTTARQCVHCNKEYFLKLPASSQECSVATPSRNALVPNNVGTESSGEDVERFGDALEERFDEVALADEGTSAHTRVDEETEELLECLYHPIKQLRYGSYEGSNSLMVTIDKVPKRGSDFFSVKTADDPCCNP